jgi:hypothetical protein
VTPKDVALPEGEWPPGIDPATFIRRWWGLSDDGLELNLEHPKNADLPKPIVYWIRGPATQANATVAKTADLHPATDGAEQSRA